MRALDSLKWVDFDLSGGISFPGGYAGTDFDNRGSQADPSSASNTNNFLSVNVGGQLQLGQFGATVMGDFLRYDVKESRTDAAGNARAEPAVSLTLGRIHAVGAYGVFNNQLVLGAGLRIATVNITDPSDPNGSSMSMVGAAPEVGVVVKPDDVPWRLGATGRLAVEANALDFGRVVVDSLGVARAGDNVVPQTITQPWEFEAGVAYQLGPRPLNPRWINPRDHEREDRTARAQAGDAREDRGERLRAERKARYLNWPRERVLFLASVLMTGPSHDAVALEGFLSQQRELVGQKVSFAPRFAAESEPVGNLLRLRAGIYIEPSRFESGTRRQHFTWGGDVRLFAWDFLGILPETMLSFSTFIDLAPRYQNFGFALNTWH